jgi:hypothetical protein
MLGFDDGVLPYDLTARATEIAGLVDETELVGADVDDALNARVQAVVAAFATAAKGLNARKGSFTAEQMSAVNAQLVDIEKTLCGGLTALDWRDATTIPHAQVLRDLEGVQAALAAMPGDPGAAMAALDDVGYTSYGKEFSREVFDLEQERHDPSYDRIFWGGLGHLPQPIDVMPAYDDLRAGDGAAAIEKLTAIEAATRAELETRLTELCHLLDGVTPQIDAVR